MVNTNCPADCVYRRRISGTTPYCAYWEIANKLRGCDPGANCTKYVAQRGKGGGIGRRATWDTQAGRAMFKQGKTCREISEALGADYAKVKECVRRWRKDESNRAVY